MGSIRYRGVFGTISTMVRTEGPRSLYNGLVAGLQRQVCFASIRIGLYDNVKNFYTGGKDSKFPLIKKKRSRRLVFRPETSSVEERSHISRQFRHAMGAS